MPLFPILLVGLALAAILFNNSGSQASPSTASRRPVVLELFTSEGCSSCPPADALLARLEEHQPFPETEIIAIEEHVDYWDHQGWVDPFSSAQWTLRQQHYASTLADHGVYTPELVVNGRLGFVGSHEGDVRRAIAAAALEPLVSVQLEPAKPQKRDHVAYKVTVAAPSQPQSGDTPELWIAITERGLHSAVSGGENAGQHLRHASVLRWLHKSGTVDFHGNPGFSSQVDAKLDFAWNRGNLRAVAFVQEKRSRHILGAAAVSVEP